MQIKEINVSRSVCFNIGQQYSNEVLVIHFKGLPDLPNKYIYVKKDNYEKEVPLVGDLYVVSRPLTTYSGEVKAQIIARDPGSTPIALTPNFKMMITPSNYGGIGEDESYPDDPNVKNYFVKIDEKLNSFEELANLVQTKLDNGEFIGEQGPKGEKGEPGEKGDPGDVTEEYRNLASQIAQNASDAKDSATNAQTSASNAQKALDDTKEFANQTKTELNQIKTDTSLLKDEANASAVNAKASETKAKEYANNLQASTDDISQLKEDIDDCLKVKYLELNQDNIINIDNLTVGVCDSDGSFTDNSGYRRTDYEFVKPNTTYSSWRMIWKNALGIIRIAFFDKNKKFISGGRDIGNIFTTPSDAYYVILTYANNENLTKERMPMVCEGKNVPEVYLPYKNECIKKVVEYVKKDDLKPHAYMPDVIYCALGRTIDIYNNQVCIDANKFHLCWTCDIGFGEGRKLTVVPSTIGDHSLKLDIYDDNNILVWTKTSTLKVVNAKTSGSITILPIGDSMTYGGATWQDEVSKKLSNGAITYVGSLEHSYRGANYNHEGYNGATASKFLNSETIRGLTNPFYNPDTSKFDWNYYKNNTRISPDVVQIELGTNDINGGTIEQAVSNISEMVDLIRKDDANIPIFICNAIYRSNQNGIAHQLNTQGYIMGNGVYKYGEDIKIQSLMVSLVEKFTDYKNVYFIPLALCHDSENNFGKQKISLNSRSKETIIIPADSSHPNKTGEDASIYGNDIVGYLQFADIMFSTFSGLIN